MINIISTNNIWIADYKDRHFVIGKLKDLQTAGYMASYARISKDYYLLEVRYYDEYDFIVKHKLFENILADVIRIVDNGIVTPRINKHLK